MSKYYEVDIDLEIGVGGVHKIPATVTIGGYVDGYGNPYDLSFRSAFWLENYTEPENLRDLFTDAIYNKKADE
ncbi:MAG: hypothetical protein DRJ03_28955 [Chloroflexi bacterium]|nr:MAG: hypothetical protein DRJ03_28955 [Chloroflexota bacterium]